MPDPFTEHLQAYADSLELADFQGAVLVAKDGRVLMARGFGYRDVERSMRNSPTTLFDIGSITKQFTAAAILKLEMMGRLRVEDTITKYFPEVPADKQRITLHHLLRHESGLPGGIGGDYDPIDRRTFTEQLFKQPLRFPTGTGFGYSNTGYSLLAMIVEDVSGMGYEEFLRTQLFEPAGMSTTGYDLQIPQDPIAIGYSCDEERWGRPTEKPWDGNAPYWHLKGNGGLLSTVEELYAWTLALDGDAVLDATARAKLFEPPLRAEETRDSYYAYGWDVHRTPRGTRSIGHNGSNRIFYSDLVRLVDEGITVIHSSNRMCQSFHGLTNNLAMLALDSTYVPQIPIAETKASRDFTRALIRDATEHGHAQALRHHAERPAGTNVLEHLVNEAGYDLLGQGGIPQAIEVFLLNTSLFPNSSNAFDSLGEGYWWLGDNEAAIGAYKRSLELDPGNGNAEDVILDIKAGRRP